MEEFQKNQTEFVFIPRGTTLYLQPFDIGINKIFKQKLKEYYLNYQVENSLSLTDTIFKVDKEFFIKWIREIQWKEDIIIDETIQKNFKKSSITFKLDGSEDNSFEFPDTNYEIKFVIDDKIDIKILKKDSDSSDSCDSNSFWK